MKNEMDNHSIRRLIRYVVRKHKTFVKLIDLGSKNYVTILIYFAREKDIVEDDRFDRIEASLV